MIISVRNCLLLYKIELTALKAFCGKAADIGTCRAKCLGYPSFFCPLGKRTLETSSQRLSPPRPTVLVFAKYLARTSPGFYAFQSAGIITVSY